MPNTEQSLKVGKGCLGVIVQETPLLANTKGKENCFPRKKQAVLNYAIPADIFQ